MAQILGVDGEQHQGGKPGGTDGIALGHRLGGIAHRIEDIGGLAHLLRQVRHRGDAAGIVGHRPEGIECHHYASQRQHRRCRHGNAEQTGTEMGEHDAGTDHQGGQRRRLHGDGKPLDDVGAVAGGRGLGHPLHRAMVGAGVVFGDPHDQPGHAKADQGSIKQMAAQEDGVAKLKFGGEAEPQFDHQADPHRREQAGGDQSLVKRAHDAVGSTQADEIGAAHRADDAHRADQQWE